MVSQKNTGSSFISVYNLEKKIGIYLITTVSPISTTKRILDKETIS